MAGRTRAHKYWTETGWTIWRDAAEPKPSTAGNARKLERH